VKSTQLRVFEDAKSVARAGAAALFDAIATDVRVQGECHVVLTGGTVGIAVLQSFTSEDSVDWSSVHLWWGDERFVESDSADRNDAQAGDALLNRIDIPQENVHRIPSSTDVESVEEAALLYAGELEKYFGVDFPHFDVVLLGVGPDGHVASLFPNMPGISERGLTVIPVLNSPKPPTERVSLTLPSLNSARRVWLFAAGVEKATAVRDALHDMQPNECPAAATDGIEQTVMFADASAAAPGEKNVAPGE
jgi:6-phosphogluconolactonase